MSKTAEEYWKAFPKHKPAKDADIAEAMREYAELYAQQRVSELEQSNKELVEASSAQKKERLIQFMVWLHTEWAPTITIPFIPEAAERYIRINELKEVVPDNKTP